MFNIWSLFSSTGRATLVVLCSGAGAEARHSHPVSHTPPRRRSSGLRTQRRWSAPWRCCGACLAPRFRHRWPRWAHQTMQLGSCAAGSDALARRRVCTVRTRRAAAGATSAGARTRSLPWAPPGQTTMRWPSPCSRCVLGMHARASRRAAAVLCRGAHNQAVPWCAMQDRRVAHPCSHRARRRPVGSLRRHQRRQHAAPPDCAVADASISQTQATCQCTAGGRGPARPPPSRGVSVAAAAAVCTRRRRRVPGAPDRHCSCEQHDGRMTFTLGHARHAVPHVAERQRCIDPRQRPLPVPQAQHHIHVV